MVSLSAKIGLSAVVLFGVLFQVYLKDLVWTGLGIGRTVQPLSDFPYECRKIIDKKLEGCEDLWLSQSTRQLFLACSDLPGRTQWMPNIGRFNASGRSRRDSIVALDLDQPEYDASKFRSLTTSGFAGVGGDNLLSLVGFTGIDHHPGSNSDSDSDSGRVELLLINNQPSWDAGKGQYLDNTGANQTLELFETGPEATELKHIRTYSHGQISTANRVAALNSADFYITNDHGPHKTGLQHHLSMLLGTGDVTSCRDGNCRKVAGGMQFPNGLVYDGNGLIYVPSSVTGIIKVFKVLPNGDLEQIDEIVTGYSLDNLSVDRNGDVWAAAFPVGKAVLDAYEDPYNSNPAATVLRIRKVDGTYVIDKIIEDGDGGTLPSVTTVVHDVETGRIFLGGVISPFISVCEPKSK